MESGYIRAGINGVYRGSKNILLKKIGKSKPTHLVFITTELCNSRCITCNMWQNKKTYEPLSPEEVKKMLKDPLFKDVTDILNTGGELTTRNDLTKLLLAEHEVLPNAILTISTNAILPERALESTKTLLEAGANIYIGISLDGIGEKHDKIRRVKGNFEKADWLLKELLKLKEIYGKQLMIAVGTNIIDEVIPNLEGIKEYVKELKIGHNLCWYNATSFYNNDGTIKENNKKNISTALKRFPPSPLNEKWLKWLDGKPIKFSCYALEAFCIIKPNGDMAPCLNFYNNIVGNVRKNTPTQIWNSEAANNARKEIKNCSGCVNQFAVEWSIHASFYPKLAFYLKHPKQLKNI